MADRSHLLSLGALERQAAMSHQLDGAGTLVVASWVLSPDEEPQKLVFVATVGGFGYSGAFI